MLKPYKGIKINTSYKISSIFYNENVPPTRAGHWYGDKSMVKCRDGAKDLFLAPIIYFQDYLFGDFFTLRMT
jgi:hypothetical protein